MAEENVESNEIRTRNILAKFQDGSTPSLTPDEVDFLIERIATGNGKYVSGSFIGIYRSQLVELISNRLASMDRSICEDVCSKIKLVQYTTANLVPQSEMVADTVLSSEKINDYGLLEALKENDKLNKKVDDNVFVCKKIRVYFQ